MRNSSPISVIRVGAAFQAFLPPSRHVNHSSRIIILPPDVMMQLNSPARSTVVRGVPPFLFIYFHDIPMKTSVGLNMENGNSDSGRRAPLTLPEANFF